MQTGAREAEQVQREWRSRLGHEAVLPTLEPGYRHVPLNIVGTIKVRYVKTERLMPRRIIVDE
jgi:hypothetical protein